MDMIELALLVYSICVLVALILYLPRIFGFRYGFKKFPHAHANEKRRIAVLIPARDESATIGDLFDSLATQDYDQDQFETFVIVQDPNDPTIAMAQQNGFVVTVVPEQHCKGDALHGFFRALPQTELRSFDAFVIVDADGYLSPSYLTEVNNALENDAEIFITRKVAKNFRKGRAQRSLFANCSALTWPMLDELANAYRTAAKMPLNLCGQGLVVRRTVIETVGGWPYRSLTEDYELKLDSLVRGWRSVYYPHAVLYTEEALGHRENFLRRVRWLTGFRQNVVNYRRQIKAKVKTEKRLGRGEQEYFYGIAPYLIYLVATAVCVVFGGGLSIYYAIVKSSLWLAALLWLVVLPLGLTYGVLLFYTLLALATVYRTFQMITFGERLAMVLFNPFYILEYLPAYLVGIYRLHQKQALAWKHTARIGEGRGR